MASHPNGRPVTNILRAPFDDEDADIIFRSSDGVDFRLYRVILAKASPVFRTMLQLPQPSSTPTAPSAPDDHELHVVTLTEDAKTLENVLRLCYPVEDPSLTSMGDIHSVLEAARKYEIAAVAANLRWALMCMLPQEPLRVYAIAYMMEMEDLAKKAATLFLDDPQFHFPPSPPPEFSVLPTLAVYAVHAYRQDCAVAVSRVLATEDWTSQNFVWLTCPNGMMVRMGPRNVPVQKWFEMYFELLKAALRERPSGRTVRSFFTSAGAGEAFSQMAVQIKFSFSITHEDGVASDN
ncbi:hypothetical protein GSI_01591 [Ganoderma sinense ZZ0214-1]|uniref:BTB domain-containing protein n=1 Tax=Ganoderma sinense ZZ0214-1 TaxID=1077348 RepID=A0A2G8SQ85_9APHY|nr:hypothetical protein GSI_01591 [Ganoderma sinense ZZ0214-1]